LGAQGGSVITDLKMAIVLLVIMPLASVAEADSENQWKYPAAPSIKTITIGSPTSLVLKELGPPLRKLGIPPSEMGMPESQDLYYTGLVIGVYASAEGEEPHVWSVHVTSNKVVIYPGITIGMTKRELIQLLGKPDSDENRDNGQWLFWTAPEPVNSFHIHLKNNRVVEFVMMEDWS
jgi:hypothetical protein